MAQLYLGLSGYDYKEWKGQGLFYPADLPATKFLDYYASRYNSLEYHGAFKQMVSEASVEKWVAKSPAGFLFAPKMNQVVTHFKRLQPEGFDTMKLFVERLEPLEKAGKLGTIYVQAHSALKRDDARLAAFLAAIPHRPTLRWSLELPHESWQAPEVEALLREHGVAWVATQTDEEEAQLRETAGHIYARLRKLDYTDAELKSWAEYFAKKISEGKDCFVYCRHKDTVAPWRWADRILELVP